jgi:hypothetical protein
MAWAEDCYDLEPDLAQYYQGDVLREVPFPFWPTYWDESQSKNWAILRPMAGTRRAQGPMNRLPNFLEAKARGAIPDAFGQLDRKEYVMVACQLRDVIILTRSCQLDNPKRKHLVVAPVTSIADLPEQEKKAEVLVSLRAYGIPHKFYLPTRGDFPESFADLLKITYLHRSFLDDQAVRDVLLGRLSSAGQSRLQHFVAAHFGESFGFDQDNVVPQDGLYSCSSCFHRGLQVRKVAFKKGSTFGPCSQCGEAAEYIKLP